MVSDRAMLFVILISVIVLFWKLWGTIDVVVE